MNLGTLCIILLQVEKLQHMVVQVPASLWEVGHKREQISGRIYEHGLLLVPLMYQGGCRLKIEEDGTLNKFTGVCPDKKYLGGIKFTSFYLWRSIYSRTCWKV